MKKIAFKINRKEKMAGFKPALWLVPLLLCLLGGSLPVYSQNPESDVRFEWAKQAGGSKDDFSTSIAVDKSGNIYTIGVFQGTANFGSQTYAITDPMRAGVDFGGFICKQDAMGNFIWVKQTAANAIALDSHGNVYVGGGAKLIKLDSNGNQIWAKEIVEGQGQAQITSITVDASGNVYFAGRFFETLDFDPGSGTNILTTANNHGDDVFVSKWDAQGNYAWAIRMGGGSSTTNAYSIQADRLGNIYITGSFVANSRYDADFGPFIFKGFGGEGLYICKLDADGNFIWAKGVSGSYANVIGYSLVVDIDGNVYTTGRVAGQPVDFGSYSISAGADPTIFLSKQDQQGNFIWIKEIKTSHEILGYGNTKGGLSVALDDDGDFYLGGTFYGTVYFESDTLSARSSEGADVFISKLNGQGDVIWAKRMGNNTHEPLTVSGQYPMTIDASGNIYISGGFQETADFGAYDLTATGESDIFICKLSEHGEDEDAGIAEHISSGSIALLPNPFRQNIHLQIDLQKAANAAISVYDLSGRQVYRLEDQKLPEGKSTLTLSPAFENVPTGIYLINVQVDNGGKWIRKVVKME